MVYLCAEAGEQQASENALNPAAKSFGPMAMGGASSRRATRVLVASGAPTEEVKAIARACGDVSALHELSPSSSLATFFSAKHALSALTQLSDRFGPSSVRFGSPSECPSAGENQGSIVLFGLSPSVSNDAISSVFNQFGPVREVRETPSKRSHRFVEFWDSRDADTALRSMHKQPLFGRTINIEFAKPGGGGAREREFREGTQQHPSPPSSPSHPSQQQQYAELKTIQQHQQQHQMPDQQPQQYQPQPIPVSTPPAAAAAGAGFGYGPMDMQAMQMHPATMQLSPPEGFAPVAIPMAPPVFAPMHSCAAPGGGFGTNPNTANGLAAQQLYHPPQQQQQQQQQQQYYHVQSGATHNPQCNHFIDGQQYQPMMPNHREQQQSSALPGTPEVDEHGITLDDGRKLPVQLWRMDASGNAPGTLAPVSITQWYSHGYYAFSREEAARADGRTTLMIRNLPNQMDKTALLAELDERAFVGEWDVLYLPTDSRNGCNLGYAFINMKRPEVTERLFDAFHSLKWANYKTRKVCEVTYARLQGRNQLISHVANSNKPVDSLPLLADDDGMREEANLLLYRKSASNGSSSVSSSNSSNSSRSGAAIADSGNSCNQQQHNDEVEKAARPEGRRRS